MINCRKYTRYLHKSEVTELNWYENILMKYHYLVCKLCKHYTHENHLINKILSDNKNDFLFTDEEAEKYKDETLKKLNI